MSNVPDNHLIPDMYIDIIIMYFLKMQLWADIVYVVTYCLKMRMH